MAMDLAKTDNDGVHAHRDLRHPALLPGEIEVRSANLHLQIWAEAVAGAGEVAVATVMSIGQAETETEVAHGVLRLSLGHPFRLIDTCIVRHCVAYRGAWLMAGWRLNFGGWWTA